MQIDITVSVACITAFSAIVAPVITAVITTRASLRIKKMDMLETGIRKSVSDFTLAYIQLAEATDCEAYWNFRSVGYSLISQCNDDEVRENVLAVADSVRSCSNKPSPESDAHMEQLMQALARYTASV